MLLMTAGSFSFKFLPHTTSVTVGSDAPLDSSLWIICFAEGIKSSSHSDLPILNPWAFKKVFAIPPPRIN